MRVVIIPAKPLDEAKLRLAPALRPEERRLLSLAMLNDVMGACEGFDHVWVLNSDAEVAAVAAAAGALALDDPAPGEGLNASLAAATTRAMRAGAEGALVVAADLPAIGAADLGAMVRGGSVAVAPDHGGSGTNALWRAPPDVIGVAFGARSLHAHTDLARAAGIRADVVERPGLALDVDRPEDLAAAWVHGVGEATRRALEEMGLPARLRLAG